MVEYQASPMKKTMIMLYGANTAVLDFDNFAQIETMLDKAVTDLGCYVFVNFINPIRHEAMKTYAYEIFSELGRVPDFSFHPMGTGGGVWGTWKGYNELAAMGVTDKVPHMVPVQPEAVCWLKRAVDSGAEVAEMYGDNTRTIAQSISGNSPLQGGRRLIRAVRESGGAAMAVSDDEILAAMVDLGHEGIGAEPSSASTVAAFKQAVKSREDILLRHRSLRHYRHRIQATQRGGTHCRSAQIHHTCRCGSVKGAFGAAEAPLTRR